MTEYKKTYKKSNGTLNPRKYGTKVSGWKLLANCK